QGHIAPGSGCRPAHGAGSSGSVPAQPATGPAEPAGTRLMTDRAQATAENGRLLRRATYASLATALLLIGLKTAVWLMSGSVSLLASLTASLVGAGASLVGVLAVGYALTPAGKGHRFGHGKGEALAGRAQSAFITLSAGLVLWQGLERLRQPMPLAGAWYGVGVMLFSII